jgi:hypothetical protein
MLQAPGMNLKMIKKLGRLVKNILTLNRSIHVLNSHKNVLLNIEVILTNHENILRELSQKQNHLPSWVDASTYSSEIKEFFAFFEKAEYPKKLLKRVGSIGDGGYLIKTPDWSNLILISVGIGDNCDFENEIVSSGGNCLAFDPTISSLPLGHSELIHFENIGLIGNALDNVKSLKMMNLNNLIESHCKDFIKNKTYRILKLDCEGAEWRSIEEISIENLQLFDQIIIEFHHIKNLVEPNHRRTIFSVAEKLQDSFQILNINPNNNSEVLWAHDLLVTDVFEITFINKKYGSPITVGVDVLHKKFPNPPFRLVAVDEFFY